MKEKMFERVRVYGEIDSANIEFFVFANILLLIGTLSLFLTLKENNMLDGFDIISAISMNILGFLIFYFILLRRRLIKEYWEEIKEDG